MDITPQEIAGSRAQFELSPDDGYPLEAPPGFFLEEAPPPSLGSAKRLLVKLGRKLVGNAA
jgi:hypothetical protein